jgi:hypothetical protein
LKVEDDLAFGGIECAQDRPAGGCLPGAALAYQPQRFALQDMKVDAIHGLHGSHTAA